MSLYAGETVLIKHSAHLDGETTALTNLDVAAVYLSIYDADLVEVLAPTVMTWVPGKSRWEHSWNSPGPTGGTYKAKCKIVGLDSSENWEYKTIRLKTKVI